jgi:hypothetical protein
MHCKKGAAETLPVIPGSFVIAHNTAFTYKGKPTGITGHIVCQTGELSDGERPK